MDEQETNQLISEIDSLTQDLLDNKEAPSLEVINAIYQLEHDLEEADNVKSESQRQELTQKLDALIETVKDNKELSNQTATDLLNSISALQINAPQVVVNPPEVIVPDITVPEIKLPTINIPPTPAPIVNNPDSIDINKPSWLESLGLGVILTTVKAIKAKIDAFSWPTLASKPISVRLSDGEKFYRAFGGGGVVGGALQVVGVKEFIPTDPELKLNPQIFLDKNAVGDLIAIRKVVNGQTFTKTFSNTDTTVSSTLAISSWSES